MGEEVDPSRVSNPIETWPGYWEAWLISAEVTSDKTTEIICQGITKGIKQWAQGEVSSPSPS